MRESDFLVADVATGRVFAQSGRSYLRPGPWPLIDFRMRWLAPEIFITGLNLPESNRSLRGTR
jgi:hypothetical protein